VKRDRVQVVLSIAPGAEPWVIVKHPTGHFRLPADAPCAELVEGAQARWGSSAKSAKRSTTYVRIPLRSLRGR